MFDEDARPAAIGQRVLYNVPKGPFQSRGPAADRKASRVGAFDGKAGIGEISTDSENQGADIDKPGLSCAASSRAKRKRRLRHLEHFIERLQSFLPDFFVFDGLGASRRVVIGCQVVSKGRQHLACGQAQTSITFPACR